jgi:hypothetical protein
MSPVQEILQRYIMAVLKLPTKVNDLAVYLKNIYAAMSAKSIYSGSAASLQILKDRVTALTDTQAAFKNNPPTKTKEERDEAQNAAILTAKDLKADVQKLANADQTHAESIITGANMAVRIYTPRGKQKFSYKYGGTSGKIILFAEGKGMHQWQSSDDGVTWVNDDPTHDSVKVYENETASKIRYYRNRLVLPNKEYGAWSQALRVPIV